MLNKYTLFLLALLLAAMQLPGQSLTLHGTVSEAGTGDPVPHAQIRVQGTQTGVLTDDSGEYELTVPGTGVVLEVSHISFKKRFLKLSPKQKHRLDIVLEMDAIRMDDVVISDGLQRVLEDKTIHLYDYEFFEDHLFMILYDREERRSKIALVNDRDSIIDTDWGPEVPGALIKDCLGNVHAITPNYACQLYVMDGQIAMYKDDRDTFEKVVVPCLAKLEEYYYYRLDRGNGQAVDYFSFNADANKADPFLQIVNDEKIHQMMDPFGLYGGMFANKDQLLAMPASFWEEVNTLNEDYQFERLAFFYPIHAPLRVIDKDICVFDHTNGLLRHLQKDGSEISQVPIDYHKLPDWKKEIFIDAYRGEAYTWTMRHGFATLHEINLKTGQLLESWELPRHFPKKVQVRNGVVYFMYKELDYDTTNRLYRMRIKDAPMGSAMN